MTSLVNVDVGSIAGSLMTGLDSLFTSDEERAKAELVITRELNQPHILQAITNIEEAKHPSVFVSGWRPALGWLCVALLAYAWVGRDLVLIGLDLTGRVEIIGQLPEVGTGELLTLTLSMLGLGATRMHEKIKGVARIK